MEPVQFVGLDNYTEIKLNSDPKTQNEKMRGLETYKYDLQETQTDGKVTCYHLDVTDIVTLGEGETLRAYLLESTSVIDNKRYMRIAEKTITDRTGTVTFTKEDFK